jgi:hypothetical protein
MAEIFAGCDWGFRELSSDHSCSQQAIELGMLRSQRHPGADRAIPTFFNEISRL